MATPHELFHEGDTNRDGYLSEKEFRALVSRNSVAGLNALNNITSNNYGNLGTMQNYDAATNQSSTGNLAFDDGFYRGAAYDEIKSSETLISPSFDQTVSPSTNIGLTGSETSRVQHYETDAQGNFKDSNPQIIRQPSKEGPLNYTQNIQVRFFKPPPVPPPGPLIIKEVRPPQPPLPPPLRVRQQAPPRPQPPPLVLRERPPPKPSVLQTETVVKKLPSAPVPPRSVVVERLPSNPPKPRDIIIERWIPYGPQPKRKTIVQPAPPVTPYPQPRNVIIQYDVPQVRVVRRFERLGVSSANPQEYIQRYGTSLIDAQVLVQQARAAGVVEDISPPDVSSLNISETAGSSPMSSTGLIGFNNSTTATAVNDELFTSDDNVIKTLSSYTASPSFNLPINEYSADNIDAAFASADINKDGALSLEEFHNSGLY